MAPKMAKQAQNPLMLRSHRLMEAFAKSDDERDFILDRMEGFILFVDLDKPQNEIDQLWLEIHQNPERYVFIPKLTFYETKKIMEGFVNEKVYDIDTKEKLIEIISSKEARENFLEFIYDHHAEMEKWQQYYVERSRIRIIEWLRSNQFEFVFEEDLELPKDILEKVKLNLFETKVSKEVDAARKALVAKAKTYYSNEALNPRPKRGRPPKQVQKAEVEREISLDIYVTPTASSRPFLFIPDFTANSNSTFSTRFESEDELLTRKKKAGTADFQVTVDNLNQKLLELRSISSKFVKGDSQPAKENKLGWEEGDDDESENMDLDDMDDEDDAPKKAKPSAKVSAKKPATPAKRAASVALKKPEAKAAPVIKKVPAKAGEKAESSKAASAAKPKPVVMRRALPPPIPRKKK